MVNDVVFVSIWAGRIARMACAIDTELGVLMKLTAIELLGPRLVLHGVVAGELQHTQAVERRIDTRASVDNEVLPSLAARICHPFAAILIQCLRRINFNSEIPIIFLTSWTIVAVLLSTLDLGSTRSSISWSGLFQSFTILTLVSNDDGKLVIVVGSRG